MNAPRWYFFFSAGKDDLTALSIVAENPVLEVPSINQKHILSSVSIVAEASVLTLPNFSVNASQERAPLVLINGYISELPVGDTIKWASMPITESKMNDIAVTSAIALG